MKYFMDTEFYEEPGKIELISIGIAAEDGRTFYAENNTPPPGLFADEWLKENVLPGLMYVKSLGQQPDVAENLGSGAVSACTTKDTIAELLVQFLGIDTRPEMWGYYCDYDWVLFCWLFGRMEDLPGGFPMFCLDVKQLLYRLRIYKRPRQVEGNHNALSDAQHIKVIYEWLLATNGTFACQEALRSQSGEETTHA